VHRDGVPISLYGREAPQRWPQHTAVTGMTGSCVRRDREVTSQQRLDRLGNSAIAGVPCTPVGDSRTDHPLLCRLWVSNAAQPCGRFDGTRKESRLKTRLTGSGRTEQNPQQRGPGCRENGTLFTQVGRGSTESHKLGQRGSTPRPAPISSKPARALAPAVAGSREHRKPACSDFFPSTFSSGRPLRK
jgi:hypothetical protein